MDDDLPLPKPGSLARTTTWLDQIPTPPIILEFVKRRYAYDHYLTLAERAKDLINKRLKTLKDSNDQGIQAKVTCRAKERDSLEEKLKMRNDARPKPYGKIKEIENDIHDLAGVRILLYTPSADEYGKVEQMLHAIWGPKVKRKPHGGFNASASNKSLAESEQDWTELGYVHDSRNESRYVPRHAGYQAIHYRTQMNKEEEEKVHTSIGPYGWMEGDRVEIQVVSAFGHAWAEAEHNVKYKSYAYGRPSKLEERILDALSGLVSSGDLLLEQFRETFDNRTFKKILYRDEFGTFLQKLDILEDPELEDRGGDQVSGYQDHFGREGVDILFRFLVVRGQNYPLAVRNALKMLGYPENPDGTLREILHTFDPTPAPPKGLLAPLCLIHHLLIEDEQKENGKGPEEAAEEVGPVMKCSIMVNALSHLQTFLGGPDPARCFLEADTTMNDHERVSLDLVLSSPGRIVCLKESDPQVEELVQHDLQPAWAWFQKQATLANPYSIHGMVFKLAKMGVTKDVDVDTLLRELSIGRLSRNNTWGSEDGPEE
jgi:ppGpp synthetase/RelA/SpoT-type nucleotidyltranferase